MVVRRTIRDGLHRFRKAGTARRFSACVSTPAKSKAGGQCPPYAARFTAPPRGIGQTTMVVRRTISDGQLRFCRAGTARRLRQACHTSAAGGAHLAKSGTSEVAGMATGSDRHPSAVRAGVSVRRSSVDCRAHLTAFPQASSAISRHNCDGCLRPTAHDRPGRSCGTSARTR
jgi:hypothetical protein